MNDNQKLIKKINSIKVFEFGNSLCIEVTGTGFNDDKFNLGFKTNVQK